ncbi:CesT family type III secretion system chaperone [Variovorax guangxiensis]|uniref:CesT family type III secretion system chaperone n=1 Tax=Variovorax guangxiensis TaxID=1775474 RepID=UPI0028546B37|nr:CesT family type III secretion system chaperone [Variovorax guangxiensis]MDR6854605.1 hypothetical protein [Variovorax guangxiensis]
MSREDYVELVQDFCEEVGFENVDELLHNGLLQVDDALVAIEYLDDRDEIRLLMDLGEIEPEEDKAAMLALLLESNLNNTSAYLPTFSIHPGTGHPIVAYHLPLAILLEEDIGLAFVLDEQLIPLRDEWKSAARQALADARADNESGPFPETFA